MRVLVLLALLGAVMAYPKNPQRIVGGEATTIDQYPYMANMQYGWFGVLWYQACGGSLITTRAVVSAAHCYLGDPISWWRTRLGSSFPESGGTLIETSSIAIHELYNSVTLDNDVAIVRLASAAVLSDVVATIGIAGPSYNVADGSWVTTIGWGTLSSGGASPNQLQHVDINVINQQLCAERYASLKNQPGFQNWPDITANMLCAGILDVGGKDACQGDSGGPLVHSNVLVGIVSWGYGCADSHYPGVNARVSAFTDWIVTNAS